MKKKENPWLPWKETVKTNSPVKEGRILAIIPTAGNNITMIKNCLDSLRFASYKEKIHIVMVLSPSTPKKKKKLEKIFGRDVEIVTLKQRFNYCRSINKGLSMKNKNDKYALFLNDDVTFTKKGDLHKLKVALVNKKWACIGPFIKYNPNRHDPTWPKKKSSLGFIPKTSGDVRTNLPVSGSCSLWNLEWINRIGKLDERFGKGWGMDEADLCLRALRLGARYGRLDSVEINHVMHATFGEEFTKYTGSAHMRSLNYFKQKYGNEIEEWGKSYHWFPLPGIQVVVFPCKNPKKFEKSLRKIENGLKGFRWILLIVNNFENQKLLGIAKKHVKTTNADKSIIKKFSNKKLSKESIIDKIAIKGPPIKYQYPAVYLVDTTRKFSKNCIRDLLWQIRDRGGMAGRMGPKKTIAEEIFPKVKFLKFKSKNKEEVHENCSIFHVNLLKN